jgi:hypothetical protein
MLPTRKAINQNSIELLLTAYPLATRAAVWIHIAAELTGRIRNRPACRERSHAAEGSDARGANDK